VTSHLPWSKNYFAHEVEPYVDGEAIQHIAQLPHARLMQTFARAKGFLFPSQWEEPFGMAVAEAMAAGTPVLAYPCGAMPELVKDGETGYLVASEDEMVEAIQNIEHLERKRCREWVREHFSVEQMVDGYEHLYREVAGKALS
jgi:glycosyltransferase involved in cell wall biosynthesis